MPVSAQRIPFHLMFLFCGVLLAALLWTGHSALAQEAEWKGFIEAMPPSGLEGEWVVGGRTFVAGSGTEFRQEKGAFAVGICAEVEYIGVAEPYTATKIATKDSDDCSGSGGGTSTPSPSPSPSPSSTPAPGDDEREAYGIVEQMPATGFIGLWRIGGVEYNAPAGTEFDQEAGPFVVGACVKVHYQPDTTPFTAREMDTEPLSDCNGSSPTPDPTSTPSGEFEVYGRIDSFPAGLIGEWRVGGVAYTATAGTEFEQEDGSFANGACVKIHADNTTTRAIMREIETERDYRCGSEGGNGGSGTPEAEIYGVVQSFPAGLIGNWNVAGMTFVADSGTEFDTEHGPFGVGVTVKIHFSTDSAGVNRAREIETKFANDSGGDDDGNGSVDGGEGHAYGLIDSHPADLVGAWRVGGVDYMATSSTRFQQEDGPFGVGARVKVEYYVDNTGARAARKIETTDDAGGATSPSHALFFGYVRQMPATGLIGTWTVDNATFVADAGTEFKENNGLLGVGAYVKIEYSMQNGQNRIHELETHVPPGAGSQFRMGVIEAGGAVSAAGVAAATWVIDGVAYTIVPATELNDQSGALTVGNTAIVNSYPAADGSRIATRVRGLTVNDQIYLPMVNR